MMSRRVSWHAASQWNYLAPSQTTWQRDARSKSNSGPSSQTVHPLMRAIERQRLQEDQDLTSKLKRLICTEKISPIAWSLNSQFLMTMGNQIIWLIHRCDKDSKSTAAMVSMASPRARNKRKSRNPCAPIEVSMCKPRRSMNWMSARSILRNLGRAC